MIRLRCFLAIWLALLLAVSHAFVLRSKLPNQFQQLTAKSPNRKKGNGKSRPGQIIANDNLEFDPFSAGEEFMQRYQTDPTVYKNKYNGMIALDSQLENDMSMYSNFWDGIWSKYKQSPHFGSTQDNQDRRKFWEYNMMNGLEHRLRQLEVDYELRNSPSSSKSEESVTVGERIAMGSFLFKQFNMESFVRDFISRHPIGATQKKLSAKAEAERRVAKSRPLLVQALPAVCQRIYDYLKYSWSPPTLRELMRNGLYGLIATVGTIMRPYIQGSLPFFIMIHGLLITFLTVRGAPKISDAKAQAIRRERGRNTFISSHTLQASLYMMLTTACLSMAITYQGLGLWAGMTTRSTSRSTLITPTLRWLISIVTSIWVNALFTASWFTFYEPPSQVGLRWRQAMETARDQDLQQAAAAGEDKQLKEKELKVSPAMLSLQTERYHREKDERDRRELQYQQEYDFAYNPDKDDEVDEAYRRYVNLHGVEPPVDAETALYQEAMKKDEHFERWQEITEAARAPPMEAQDITGADLGVPDHVLHEYETSPRWIQRGVDRIMKKFGDGGKGKDPLLMRKKIPGVDVEPIYGPFFFRPKAPAWMKRFTANEVPTIGGYNPLGKQYGTYRRAMYKLDKSIRLEKTDGGADALNDGATRKPLK